MYQREIKLTSQYMNFREECTVPMSYTRILQDHLKSVPANNFHRANKLAQISHFLRISQLLSALLNQLRG